MDDSLIRRWEREGILRKSKVNCYHLIENLERHREWKESKVVISSDEEIIDFNFERARKMRADAEAQERKNKIASEELVPLEEVKAHISDAVGICAKILGSLKLNIARIAPEIPNRALDEIGKEQAKMLTAVVELDERYQARESDSLVVATGE